MEKKIIDVSHHNSVDWARASPELGYVILRASHGTKSDTKFAVNVRECEQCRLPYGVYHYVEASDARSAVAEADYFYSIVMDAGAAPSVFFADVEHTAQTKANTENICWEFLLRLRELGCAKVGLYISSSHYPWAGSAIEAYDAIWLPRYGKNDGNIPSAEYRPVHPCDLWQYTSKGVCAGITGGIDMSILYGDKPMEYFTTTKDGGNGMAEINIDGLIYDPRKVVAIALREVGYLEKASNSQLDEKTANAGSKNYTKYARDLDAISFYNGRKNGYAWCDVFVDWCMVQVYGKEAALALSHQPTNPADNTGAGCKYSRSFYKKNGRLFDAPQAGDQIFFYPSDGIGGTEISHTGLVVDVDRTYVYTVEGNTSSASGVVANGGCVAQKKYKRSYNRIAGYGRPDYGTSIPDADSAIVGSRVLFNGCGDGRDVAALQNMLMQLGYALPKYGADGDFGSETVTALKSFQYDRGIEQTGILDPYTFDVLMAAQKADPEPEPKQEQEYVLILRGDRQRLSLVHKAYGGVLAAVEMGE